MFRLQALIQREIHFLPTYIVVILKYNSVNKTYAITNNYHKTTVRYLKAVITPQRINFIDFFINLSNLLGLMTYT